MTQDHDPTLQAHYLRQCLSHDKRPIGLLLGAGCPMAIRVSRGGSDEPLIPDIAGVTAIVFSEMRRSGLEKPFDVAHSHWKIHGSLNWYEGDRGNIHRGLPSGGLPAGKRRVIYPSHLKYDESRQMPYLCMVDRLRYFFKNAAPVLITCGFSFGDQHLNEVLVQGLQGNPTAIIFALLHGDLSKYTQATTLARNRINLNVLARDKGIVGTRSATWMQGRDANSCTDSTAVKWVTDPVNTSLKNAQFSLGDFQNFATFARELIGQQSQSGGP